MPLSHIAAMFSRLWMLSLFAALTVAHAEVVPTAVEAYRKKTEDPIVLAQEILLLADDQRPTTALQTAVPRELIALDTRRTKAEIEKALELTGQLLEQKAQAATSARLATSQEPKPEVLREEAQLWQQVMWLARARGDAKAALAAHRRQLEALSNVATPEEWLVAALDLARSCFSSGETTDAVQLMDLAKKLTAKDGPLADSPAAAARVQAFAAWMDLRDDRIVAGQRIETMRAAASKLSETLGEKHPETLAALASIAASPVTASVNREILITNARSLLAGREALYGPRHPLTLSASAKVGHLLWNDEQREESYPFLQRACEGWLAGSGLATEDRVLAGTRMANWERENGDYAAAEKSFRATLASGTPFLGADHRRILGAESDLAMVLGAQGDFAAAAKLSGELFERRSRLFGPTSNDALVSMNNLGVNLMQNGRFRDGESMLTKTLELRRKQDPPVPGEILRSRSNLAQARLERGYPAEAAPELRKVWEDRRQQLGFEQMDTFASAIDLANCSRQLGDLGPAEQFAREGLEGRDRLKGEDHPSTLTATGTLATILSAKGQHPKALELLYHATGKLEARYGAEAAVTLRLTHLLGNALREAGNDAEAEKQLRFVHTAYEKRWGASHPLTIEAGGDLGIALLQKGDLGAAEPYLRQALTDAQNAYDADHPLVGELSYRLALMLHQKAEDSLALPLATKAVSIVRERLPDHRVRRERYERLLQEIKPPSTP